MGFLLKFKTLDFARTKRKKEIQRVTLEKRVVGEVIEKAHVFPSTGVVAEAKAGAFVILYNDKEYQIHPDCFDTYKKRKVFVRDNNGKWIEYDRPCSEDRIRIYHAIPFRPRFLVIGNVVQENQNVYFKIRACFNKADIETKGRIIKQLKKEDEIEEVDDC